MRYNEVMPADMSQFSRDKLAPGALNDRWNGFLCEDTGCDIETKDPLLLEAGPGMYRKDGYICGVALSTPTRKTYLELNHPDTPPEEAEKNRRFLGDYLQNRRGKCGANIMYDLDWLQNEFAPIAECPIQDVQFAEPLLNEYRPSYSLSALCGVYKEQDKGTDALAAYCTSMGWKDGYPRAHIWRMPAAVVAEYAGHDAQVAQFVHAKQLKELEAQGLLDVYNMEVGLVHLLLLMRRTGVRLDIPALGKTALAVSDMHYRLKERLQGTLGTIDLDSTKELAQAFDRVGIPYPRHAPTERMTERGITRGNPMLNKEALEGLSNMYPVCKDILTYRHFGTLISMFFTPYLGLHIGGRIHCQFNPLRSDNYGTVSGRFSSTKPNLQQVSGTNEEGDEEADNALHGKIVRNLFIPEEGHLWAKLDYSQVEYRLIAHYATGRGADELRRDYNNNAATDYHQRVMDKTGFDRTTSKRLNFGTAYGMGVATCARKFGWSLEEAALFLENYHNNLPFVKESRRQVVRVAEKRGYIFTLLGRRARVHPSRKLHSMFNRLIQGSAADVMKKAMLDAWHGGIFNVLLPHLTVHDELDVSVPKTKEGMQALKELQYTMEHAFTLSVPLLVDCKAGERWGEVKAIEEAA